MVYKPEIRYSDRFTCDLAPGQRELLGQYAEAQGISSAECLRRIIAEKFAQLREDQT